MEKVVPTPAQCVEAIRKMGYKAQLTSRTKLNEAGQYVWPSEASFLVDDGKGADKPVAFVVNCNHGRTGRTVNKALKALGYATKLVEIGSGKNFISLWVSW